MKKISASKAKADKLFSQYIRKDGICERCGRTNEVVQLQCAHIFSRRFLVTRYDPLNCLCLCAGCHRWGHDNPVEFTEWVKEFLGEAMYDELRFKAKNAVHKLDYEAIIADLKERLA